MKNRLSVLFIVLLIFSSQSSFIIQKSSSAEAPDWKLAYQSFTFKNFTFEEGLQKAKELGLDYVEAYRAQKLTAENSKQTHFDSDEATLEEMKQLLNKYQIKMINYGVVKGKNQQEWKRIFEFARKMGVETLVAEPEPSQFDFWKNFVMNII